jgi:hypothetical protein
MNTSELSLVPLQQATLCLDCEMITAAHTRCFACGSVALMSLARALNGDTSTQQLPKEIFVVKKNSPRPKQPAAFDGVRCQRRSRVEGRYANLRSVLSSVIVRPVRHALAQR